jgi:hypothetical protein
MMRLIAETNAFDPSALEFRRNATVEFLGLAVFTDRRHGARLAARVLADTPMPKLDPAGKNESQIRAPELHEIESGNIEQSNIEAAKTSAVEVRNK